MMVEFVARGGTNRSTPSLKLNVKFGLVIARTVANKREILQTDMIMM